MDQASGNGTLVRGASAGKGRANFAPFAPPTLDFVPLDSPPGIAGGNLASARVQADEISRLDAARAHSVLGSLALREKDFSKAEAQLRMALATSPNDHDRADVQRRLAIAYEQLGRKEEAVAALKEARRLDPDNPQARKEFERNIPPDRP